MKFSRTLSMITLLIAGVLSTACSNHKSPLTPAVENMPWIVDSIPECSTQNPANHRVLAVYDAVIDPAAGTFNVEPAERSADFHFPLTQLFPNALKITGYGFTPNFWADIKLMHPLPGSGIDVFDPRIIAILPANDGVRFINPALGVGGNNAVVLEPDGYTGLFDDLGGSILGNVNPFKAYFQGIGYRRWSSTGVNEETLRWQMNLAGFGGPMVFKLVVDVSTNYPAPPQEIVDNLKGAVDFVPYVNSYWLTTAGGSASVSVNVATWNGNHPIPGKIVVSAPALQDEPEELVWDEYGYDFYSGDISNTKHAPEGEYSALIAAPNENGVYLYKEIKLTVNPATKTGDLKWVKSAGGSSGDTGYSVCRTANDSVIVTGSYAGTSTFGKGEANQKILTSSGGKEIFVAKYNSDGTLAWAKSAGGLYDDEGLGISCDDSGSSYVTGYFNETATFGIGEVNQTVLVALGYKEIFIAKYNADGTLQWAKHPDGSGNDEGKAIIALSDGCALTGNFMSTEIRFGSDDPDETTLHLSGNSDIFVARYNSDGTIRWAKKAGGAAYDEGSGMDVFADNSIAVTGYYGAIATWGSGEPNQISYDTAGAFDVFAAKYNSDGTVNWVKRAGGVTGDVGKGITVLASEDSVVATGFFSNSAVFGFGETNQTALTSAGDNDIYFACLDYADGTLNWAKQAGGTSRDESFGITSLEDGSFIVTGHFMSTAVFGIGDPNETALTSAGGFDAFYTRYDRFGSLVWAKRAGGAYWEWAYSVAALSNDASVVTGYYTSNATFGPGETNESTLSAVGACDIFVARLKR